MTVGLVLLSWILITVCIPFFDSGFYASAQSSTLKNQVGFKEWYENQSRQPSVLITTPINGQQIPVANGNNSMSVAGTSSDNSTSDCIVAVILNAVRPYQNATGFGPGGAVDYSTWNLIIDPAYYLASIKEGPDNEVAAKITCSDGSVIRNKSYSVNVTATSVNVFATGTNQSSLENSQRLVENNTGDAVVPPDSLENSLSASLGNLTRSLNNTLNSILRPLE